MKKILLSILISMFTVVNIYGQNKITKENVSNNWMVWSVKSEALTGGIATSRTELKKAPKVDFLIESNGNYNIRWDNLGSGTWRLDGNHILFFKKPKDSNKVEMGYVMKVISVTPDKMIIKLLTPSKMYDMEFEVVPFN